MMSAIVAPSVRRSDISIAKGRCPKKSTKISPTVSSATQPSPRLARVTPSWLAESMREILEAARRAKRASLSPLRIIASRRVRLERTRANSAPTKNPLRSTSRIMASSRPSTDTTYHNTAQGHQHAGGHHHGVGHSHGSDAPVRNLRIALVLTATLLVVEVIGGILSNSIALLRDAGHMLTGVAAIAIRYTGWLVADPIASILTTVLIMRGAWLLVRESVDILLESTPAHIPLPAVRGQLEAIPGIESVHDLHVWAVTPAVVAMSAHCIVREPAQHQHVLEHIHDAMRLFGIEHVTIQLERDEMLDRESHLHA